MWKLPILSSKLAISSLLDARHSVSEQSMTAYCQASGDNEEGRDDTGGTIHLVKTITRSKMEAKDLICMHRRVHMLQ